MFDDEDTTDICSRTAKRVELMVDCVGINMVVNSIYFVLGIRPTLEMNQK